MHRKYLEVEKYNLKYQVRVRYRQVYFMSYVSEELQLVNIKKYIYFILSLIFLKPNNKIETVAYY